MYVMNVFFLCLDADRQHCPRNLLPINLLQAHTMFIIGLGAVPLRLLFVQNVDEKHASPSNDANITQILSLIDLRPPVLHWKL